MAAVHSVPRMEAGDNGENDWQSTSFAARASSPPRVNPYHLIHHPDTDELLPPLPPHLARLASGEGATDDEGSSDTSDDDSDSDEDEDENDDIAVGSRNRGRFGAMQRSLSPRAAEVDGSAAAVARAKNGTGAGTRGDTDRSNTADPSLSSTTTATPNTAPQRIMTKVTNVFRRADKQGAPRGPGGAGLGPGGLPPQRQRSPMMQGPPPSPPLSDASDNEQPTTRQHEEYQERDLVHEEVDRDQVDTASIAVTEATETDDAMHQHQRVQTPEPRPSMNSQLKPVTEAGETAQPQHTQPAFSMNLTSEPDSGASSSRQPVQQHHQQPPQPQPPSPNPARSSSRDSEFERPQPPFLGVGTPRRVSTGSTSSRAGSLSMVRSGRLAPQRDYPGSPDTHRTLEISEDRVRPSIDTVHSTYTTHTHDGSGAGGAIHAPPHRMQSYPLPAPAPLNMSFQNSSANASPASGRLPRLERRNTNPTSPVQPMSGSSQLTHSISISSHTPTTAAARYDSFISTLPPDIVAQTEIVRRERLEKRQKKLSLLAAAAPQPETSHQSGDQTTEVLVQRKVTVRRKETDETKVLVGNLVGEGHRNYVLMYNMLTGIRVAVSRCQAKTPRPITDEDYRARHKYSFDMLGNELTPSARYDFKFKDYAPWVFRELREQHFHIDPADYLLSLTAKYILSELGSPGKSGSFFYYSRDYRFIIKTISHSEHAFLRSILKNYHEHVRSNPHTLLSRFYGLHRVKMPRGRKIHFVIMNNLFPPHRDIHETYDLKGSAWGREYPEDKAANNPRAVLKDKNWVNRGRTLELGPEKRALLTEQLRRDMEFLKDVYVMDYSLLIGIHNMERGNRDNLRTNHLAVFHPNTEPVRRKPSAVKSNAEAHNVRKAVVRADPKRLDAAIGLPQEGSDDRRHFLFYQDEGGLVATDEQNAPLDVIYYLGVIDICTPYNTSKRIEHAWKSMTENAVTISCVDPVTYGHRFLDFLMSVMRGGDPKLRPEGLEPDPKSKEVVTPQPVGSEHDKENKDKAGRPSLCCSARPLSTPPPVEPIIEMSEVDDVINPDGTIGGATGISVRTDEYYLAPPPRLLSAFDEKSELHACPVTMSEGEHESAGTLAADAQAQAHDNACASCQEHERPAIVGHLKTE